MAATHSFTKLLRLTPEEHKSLVAMAEKYGMTTSAFLRYLIHDAALRGIMRPKRGPKPG